MGRVSVTLQDARGHIRAKAGDAQYEGEIQSPPRAISLGQRLDLVLVRTDVVPPDEPLSLVGKVVEVAHVAPGVKNTPLHAGLRFTVDVAEIARAQRDASELVGKPGSGVFRRPDPVIASLGALPVFDDLEGLSEGDTVLAPPPFMTDEASPKAFPHTTSEELMREPTGVIGTLRHVTLAEVIQGLELGRRTARIDIRSGEDGLRGTIYLKHGQLVSARFVDEMGEGAFYRLARLRSGTYRVRFDREPEAVDITAPTAFLILEAMRKMDEEAREKGVEPPVLPQLTGEFRVSPANVTLPPPPVLDTKNDQPPVKVVTRTRDGNERPRTRAKDPSGEAGHRGKGTFSGFFEEAKEDSGEEDPEGVVPSSAFAYEPSFVSIKVALRAISDSQRLFIGDTDWSRVLSSSEPSVP